MPHDEGGVLTERDTTNKNKIKGVIDRMTKKVIKLALKKTSNRSAERKELTAEISLKQE